MTHPAIHAHAEPTPPPIDALTAAADREGHPFVGRTVDEWASGENRFDGANEAFFVAELDGDIVGMCGINVDHHLNDPQVGRLRHLYVHPAQRGTGLGAELVHTCLRHAAGRFQIVRLRTPGPVADRFYDNLGFDRSASGTATHEWMPALHESELWVVASPDWRQKSTPMGRLPLQERELKCYLL